jgi:hypothetical protein
MFFVAVIVVAVVGNGSIASSKTFNGPDPIYQKLIILITLKRIRDDMEKQANHTHWMSSRYTSHGGLRKMRGTETPTRESTT